MQMEQLTLGKIADSNAILLFGSKQRGNIISFRAALLSLSAPLPPAPRGRTFWNLNLSPSDVNPSAR